MEKLLILPSLLSLLLLGSCGSEASETTPADNDAEHSHEEGDGHDHDGDDHGHEHGDGDGHDHDHGDPAEAGAFAVPETGKVFFEAPADGATVSSPFTVKFGVEEVGVEPAGALVANTGHHHIIVNGAFIPTEQIVPADENNIHYGLGQTEAELDLPAGTHTLTMQLADGIHRSYGEAFSATITVTVE